MFNFHGGNGTSEGQIAISDMRNLADENINSWYLRMYVASGRIHFTWADDTALTLVVDITIGGQAPDDIT